MAFSTRNQPRKGTRDFVVREVAEKEGWTEDKARAILADGFANGSDTRQAGEQRAEYYQKHVQLGSKEDDPSGRLELRNRLRDQGLLKKGRKYF